MFFIICFFSKGTVSIFNFYAVYLVYYIVIDVAYNIYHYMVYVFMCLDLKWENLKGKEY